MVAERAGKAALEGIGKEIAGAGGSGSSGQVRAGPEEIGTAAGEALALAGIRGRRSGCSGSATMCAEGVGLAALGWRGNEWAGGQWSGWNGKKFCG